MGQRYFLRSVLILVLVAAAVWVDLPSNPGIHIGSYNRDIQVVRGLDLQGGLRVLLEADLPLETEVTSEQIQTVRDIIENRVNGLGVTEPLVQVAGTRRILVELPGIGDPDQAVAAIQQTGLLEFVEVGPEDRIALLSNPGAIATDFEGGAGAAGPADSVTTTPAGQTPSPSVEPTLSISTPSTEVPQSTSTAGAQESGSTTSSPTPEPSPTPVTHVYHTVMTGAALEAASVSRDQLGQYLVAFKLKDADAALFAEYTRTHIGGYLAIVLDKRLISVPRISEEIPRAEGSITGDFTYEQANQLAVQLRYGSLPIPLKVVDSKVVGPTLGQDSLRKSTIAGVIGLGVVILFMALYYRLPGVLADMALLVYALLTFALFKLIPVTLTLPGIAGFVLSIGVAVDANVLIFERMKEELRSGRTLRQAIDLGFKRAWPSIRDSNLSTLITCAILYWFGSTFGASMVKGFSLTLALGVAVSLFTAITVTRNFLHVVLDGLRLTEHPRWFGI